MTEQNNTDAPTIELVIDLFNTPSETTEDLLKQYRVVVVDVLRSATSIITALHNGARDIIPTVSAAAGIALSVQLKSSNILLCGEREGRVIEGFDLGNSPCDFTRGRVEGRTLVFGSSNGTPMVVKAAGALRVYFCGLVNLDAVVELLATTDKDTPIAIACAGESGQYSIEDVVCGGLLISRLRKKLSGPFCLNDGAHAAEIVSQAHSADLESLMHQTDHGKYLIEIGAERDLSACAHDSIYAIVPVLVDGKLIPYKAEVA